MERKRCVDMRIKQGKKTEKETICWDCQNYSRCSWSRGKPVKGWKATPTKIIDVYGGGRAPKIVDSFLVEDCPHFKPDKKRRVTIKYIAEILGIGERRLFRIIQRKGVGRLEDLLLEKGYKLYTAEELPIDGKIRKSYYIEKI